MATRPVRVWLSTRTRKAGTVTIRARRGAIRRQLHSTIVRPTEFGRVVRNLWCRYRPERAHQSALGQGVSRRDQQAENDRAHNDQEATYLGAQNE